MAEFSAEKEKKTPEIIDLFDKERLEEIQDKIGKATGLAFVTVDYTGNPITKLSCFSSFCKRVRGNDDCRIICQKSDAFGALQAAISHKPFIYYCPCGLLEVAIPIEENGAFLGGFIGGQVLCDDAPADTIHLNQLFDQKKEFTETPEMCELRRSAKHYPFSQYKDIVNLIHLIVSQFYESKNYQLFEKNSLETESEEIHELEKEISHLNEKLSFLTNFRNEFFFSQVFSTISGLAILENAERTNALLLDLSDYIKESGRDLKGYWSLEEEILQIRRYIRLTCSRFGDRFNLQINVPDSMKVRRLPVFLLLPYVQHAVYYGVALKKDEAVLTINVNEEKGNTVVDLTENGPGYSEHEISELFRDYGAEHEGAYIEEAISRNKMRIIEEFGRAFVPEISVGRGVGRRFRIVIPGIFAGGTEGEVGSSS
ncbi:MAG: PocR ligand-binding domain-containing protein [Lachnospiraceae bacterium]|nr:PocR ligand-binding domain-containing protein [Lachnospiraceae bacterium]